MARRPLPAIPTDAVLKRSTELDALDAILPLDRRDPLAEILTDDDVETLKHLAAEGIGASLPWPAPESLLLKYVSHHL